MNNPSLYRCLLVFFWIFLCQFHFSHSSFCQTIPQNLAPSNSDSFSAEEYLRIVAGAIITKTSDGRAVGFQMPEGRTLNDQAWQYLVQLTDLQDLDLGAMHLSNDQVKKIGGLTELRSLNLFGNPIDSISMTYLTDLQNLETLYLYRTFVDDVGLESIAKLKNLKRLNMLDTFLTDVGLKTIGACKQLTHLSIGNSKAEKFPESFFSPEGLTRLRSELPNTEITFWGSNDDHLDSPKLISQSTPAQPNSRLNRSVTIAALAKAPDLSKREGIDWPCFLGSTGDGKSLETGLSTDWISNPPKLLWHKKAGTGFAAPSVSKGRLMLYQRVRNEDGDQRFCERLTCLHSETGEKLWRVDFPTNYQDLNGYGDGPRSSPVIDGNRVFILSPEGMLRCLQCVDGKLVWEVDLREDFNCDLIIYGVGTTPVVLGNRLLIIVGGKLPQNSEAAVVALDKQTGVFQYSVGKGAASYATPLIRKSQGRSWCFAFIREGLLVFEPETGKIDFEFPWRSNIAGCVNAATPVVENDRVLISEAYGKGSAMLQFFGGGYQPLWQDTRASREKSLQMHWATPIYHEGFLYGCSGRHSAGGVLKCVDWQSGKTLWKQKSRDRTSLTYFDRHFVSLGENGVLTLFKASPNGYQEVGRLDENNTEVMPSYPAWGAPVISRGLLYVRGKHEIICYDISRGSAEVKSDQ